MIDIKKTAAGIIAGAAITAAPLVAFAGPASAATNASEPSAAAGHARVLVDGANQLGSGVAVPNASQASHCGGGMHCSDCGCS